MDSRWRAKQISKSCCDQRWRLYSNVKIESFVNRNWQGKPEEIAEGKFLLAFLIRLVYDRLHTTLLH